MKFNTLIPLILLQTFIIIALTTCLTNDTLKGCTNCTAGESQSINITTNLYICTQIANCIIVDNNGSCIQCGSGNILKTVNSTKETSCELSSIPGCQTMLDSVCTSCLQNTYALNSTTNTCILLVIDYCWKTDTSGCTMCSDENIVSQSNCAVNTTVCPNFNYQKWNCPSCSGNLKLHQSGIFCYDPTLMQNCLVISISGCIQCNFGYYISTTKCVIDSTFTLQFQLLPTSYYLGSLVSNVRVCLDANSTYDTTTLACKTVTSGINYCELNNLALCNSCVKSFYLTNNLCKPCDSLFSNCLLCDSNNCQQCIPTYFLVLQSNTYNISQVLSGINSTTTSCLPCTIYACSYCRSEFDVRGIFNVRCDKCLFGYKLHNHTCLSCPSGYYFSLSLKVCTACAITNCMYCNLDESKCEQCTGTFYYNITLNICMDMNVPLTSQIITSDNAYQILNKSFTLSTTTIINDQKLLMTNCAGTSNGFACLCGTNITVSYTSLCYSITTNLVTMPLNFASFGLTNTSYSTSYFKANAPLILLLSQLPTYSWTYSPISTELLSNSQFANYLQISFNYIRNHPSNILSLLQSISQLVFNQLSKTFDPYQPTILSGPGYYFKYTPANPTSDDTTVASISQTTISSIIFIYFNSTVDSSIKRITGNSYVFLNQAATTQLNLILKKISFLGNNQNYIIMVNGNQLSLSVSSNSDGYVTITNITTSNSSTGNSYFVSSQVGSVYSDQFTSERIENIIYRVAFIYILIFLVLYLTLIPFCALFDCVDNKSSKRKIKSQIQETYQGIKQRSQTEIEEEVALKINYKDFFPIYNIANTERPKRLLKLCLFLVNSQHSITFLSLIYFNLPSGQPLVAVLLAIPAYMCTVILGYLCGIFTLKIPGNFKYLINIVTLGYWILWVPIMASFKAYEYAPYIFTFAIIFFFIDMLIDFLETLLMYFTIKQQSRQIKLFKALSKWLSYRGYYQFNKMAKEIDEIRNNDG